MRNKYLNSLILQTYTITIYYIIFLSYSIANISLASNSAINQLLLLDDEIIVDIDVGGFLTCVLFDNGKVKCWGTGFLPSPQYIDFGNYKIKRLFVNDISVCGLNSINELTCKDFGDETNTHYSFTGNIWGDYNVSQHGKIFDFSLINSSFGSPKHHHACFYTSKYTPSSFFTNTYLFCLGHNRYGEIGFDPNELSYAANPVLASAVGGVTSIGIKKVSVSKYFSCYTSLEWNFINSSYDGVVKCSGSNEFGKQGNGDNSLSDVHQFQRLSLNGESFVDIALGNYHACVIEKDVFNYRFESEVKCWGDNDFYQLGVPDNPQPSYANTPRNVNNGVQYSIGHNFMRAYEILLISIHLTRQPVQ